MQKLVRGAEKWMVREFGFLAQKQRLSNTPKSLLDVYFSYPSSGPSESVYHLDDWNTHKLCGLAVARFLREGWTKRLIVQSFILAKLSNDQSYSVAVENVSGDDACAIFAVDREPVARLRSSGNRLFDRKIADGTEWVVQGVNGKTIATLSWESHRDLNHALHMCFIGKDAFAVSLRRSSTLKLIAPPRFTQVRPTEADVSLAQEEEVVVFCTALLFRMVICRYDFSVSN